MDELIGGLRLAAPEAEAVAMTVGHASGETDEAALERWLDGAIEQR